MPLLLLILAGVIAYAAFQGQAQALAALPAAGSSPGSGSPAFSVGQTVNIAANTQLYSDQALTQNVGQWPGGTSIITAVDPNGVWVGFTSQTGSAPMAIYVPIGSVSASAPTDQTASSAAEDFGPQTQTLTVGQTFQLPQGTKLFSDNKLTQSAGTGGGVVVTITAVGVAADGSISASYSDTGSGKTMWFQQPGT
jgi:hypothetical protein